MTGPMFLGIGAQKAGTTWLHQALQLRPDVWLPPVKELHFFDEKVDRYEGWFDHLRSDTKMAKRWRRQVAAERQRRRSVPVIDDRERELRAWCSRYFFEEPSVSWYRSLFAGFDSVSGEITPEYAILSDEEIARIVAVLPDVRAIYLLRHPIEREWSAAQMGIRKGLREPDSVLQGRHLHARYPRIIDRWTRHLGPERVFVGWYDDIGRRPKELLADVLAFIGCSTDDIVLPEGRPNRGNIDTIPGEYAVALAGLFADEIDELAARFGRPGTDWAEIARWLISDRPAGQLTYPLTLPS